MDFNDISYTVHTGFNTITTYLKKSAKVLSSKLTYLWNKIRLWAVGAYSGPKPGSKWYEPTIGTVRVHRILNTGEVEYFLPCGVNRTAYPRIFKAIYKEIKK